MAYFHCLIGGGSSGGGYELTVTCDAVFAGTTITCTDGVTTLTSTCPSSSPYVVEFEISNGGTWTVSGIASGSTCTASIDIPDELELIAIPEGSTVTPTDVIQTWLRCGGIFDKSYTTLNEVLADSTTLLALMSNNNAVDYLVRSTTWASGITADSTAMTDIGANNYCANTLLNDSTWVSAIANSTYFESVLNVKVPTMTSNTTPSGVASSNSVMSGYDAYKAFDGNDESFFIMNTQTSGNYIRYQFSSVQKVYLVKYHSNIENRSSVTYKIQGSNDGSTWNDLKTITSTTATGYQWFSKPLDSIGTYLYYQVVIVSISSADSVNFSTLQFYGRADV